MLKGLTPKTLFNKYKLEVEILIKEKKRYYPLKIFNEVQTPEKPGNWKKTLQHFLTKKHQFSLPLYLGTLSGR